MCSFTNEIASAAKNFYLNLRLEKRRVEFKQKRKSSSSSRGSRGRRHRRKRGRRLGTLEKEEKGTRDVYVWIVDVDVNVPSVYF